MIQVNDLIEWIKVAGDAGYLTIQGAKCWFAYDYDNHSICGFFDETYKRGMVFLCSGNT